MKEYKVVSADEGIKGIKFGNKVVEDNINVLAGKYAAEGWEVFQFLATGLDVVITKIVFVRDKQ